MLVFLLPRFFDPPPLFFAESILGQRFQQNENHQWYIYLYIWASENQQRRGRCLKDPPNTGFLLFTMVRTDVGMCWFSQGKLPILFPGCSSFPSLQLGLRSCKVRKKQEVFFTFFTLWIWSRWEVVTCIQMIQLATSIQRSNWSHPSKWSNWPHPSKWSNWSHPSTLSNWTHPSKRSNWSHPSKWFCYQADHSMLAQM